jgi:pectate lyase
MAPGRTVYFAKWTDQLLIAALLLGCALLTAGSRAAATLPAFPGAEGFGAATPGGRGGRVWIVRTLADSGPGSLREALAARGPRTVVFAVGGLITLQTPLDIREPFLTIAGQTAPGDGIAIRGAQVSIQAHDIVVRHLRFRPGDIAKAEADALNIVGDSHDVIVDHCSASWSVDEALSPSGAIRDVTVQWSLIAEALNRSIHSKGAHGYGSLVRAAGGVTLHHNLWAHNSARNPRLGDNYGREPWPTFDVRNNVIYDYGDMASGMTGDRLSVNYVANYVRPGPSSNRTRGIVVLTDTASATYYVDGNIVDGLPGRRNDATLFDRTEKNGTRLVTIVGQPFSAPTVRTTSAVAALEDVLADAGATRPQRDAVDARIVRSVRERSGSVIDSQAQVGGWPEYKGGMALADTDEDGMPDDWEGAHGLDPHEASDAARPTPSGYTNIELYMNERASGPPSRSAPRR